MSLLDSNLDYSITVGQKYMVFISIDATGFGPDFHRSMWTDKVYVYDYSADYGWFHKEVISKAISELPIEQLQCGQPYRYIKKIIRDLAKPKFQWAAKFTPAQSQISVRMGQNITISIKVKDMGEHHWRPYMKIYLQSQGQLTPF